MEEEFAELEEAGGDTAEMQVAAVGGGETESILVVLTSIFLLIAIALIMIKLYSSYGFFKSEDDLRQEEVRIEKKYLKS